MNARWMSVYAVVLGLASAGCFYSWDDGYADDGEDYSYDDDYEDDYHGTEAVRQALTSPSPEVDNAGYNPDAYEQDWCEVHAQCPQGYVCASDPVCPDYLYCYSVAEAGCDCDDRFNTACWFGECVLRGVDCAGGCPTGTVCDAELGGCICPDGDCSGAVAPQPEPRVAAGEKCIEDDDCEVGSCVDGACAVVYCDWDEDCPTGQSCCELYGDDFICGVDVW